MIRKPLPWPRKRHRRARNRWRMHGRRKACCRCHGRRQRHRAHHTIQFRQRSQHSCREILGMHILRFTGGSRLILFEENKNCRSNCDCLFGIFESARPLHYSKSDSRLARAPAFSPCYSLTHPHRFIGYHNRHPQPLTDSSTRLMYLRVYDSRISSHQPAPSPSLCDLLTHAHSTLPTPTLITIT